MADPTRRLSMRALGALLIGNLLLFLTVGCGDSDGGSVDIAASKKASANGGLQFPGPANPDQPKANLHLTLPDPAEKPR